MAPGGRLGQPACPGESAGGLMGRRLIIMVAASAAAAWCTLSALAGPAGAGVVSSAGPAAKAVSWRNAIEVPGSGKLNAGGEAEVTSVSCRSAGSCSAGGSYVDGSGHGQAFVVSSRKSHWGRAIDVPGLSALHAVGSAIFSVACGSAGDCAAGGYEKDASGREQGLVVIQKKGRWGKAIKVPGSAALNVGGVASVSSVSCGSAGSCAAGGYYRDGTGRVQVFVVSEKKGRWGKAIEVPGSGALNAGGDAVVNSVSCKPGGNCVAGGLYEDGSDHGQAFVVSSKKGRWGKASKVPGSGALNAGGSAGVYSVSCGSAGNCAAGGYYRDGSGHIEALVVSEKRGRWGKAIEVPRSGALNAGGDASVDAVSCASAGSCSAGGSYVDGSGRVQTFVVSSKNGRWGTASEVPGSGALNAGGAAAIDSVSCASAGNCAAVGFYQDGFGHNQAFVVSETNGRWGKGIKVPGSAALNEGGNAGLESVSCGAARSCAAGGYYRDGSGHSQAFVVWRA